MNRHQGHLLRLFAALAAISVARACAYLEMGMEPPQKFFERHCAVGCAGMQVSDQNYVSCCFYAHQDAQLPALCSQLASANLATTTCPPVTVRTTDSTGYAAPTDYSTAGKPTGAATTAQPATSGIEGQSVSYETGGAGTVTQWTTTTLPAPCESTAPPAPTPPQTTNSNTCECTETTSAYPTAPTSTSASPSSSQETSNIEGSAYPSDYASDSGVTAGSTPPTGLTGLDRRTEKQYTCACPAATSDTSDVQGQPFSSSTTSTSTSSAYSSSSSSSQQTSASYASDAGVVAGAAPPPGMEISENAKRFLPTIYGPGPGATGPAVKRLHDHVRDAGVRPTKRTYDEPSSAGDGAPQQTVTSTVTVIGTCGDTGNYPTSSAAQPTSTESACDYESDSGVTAGNTPSESVTENARRRVRRSA